MLSSQPLSQTAQGVQLQVKVVPGASRTRLAGQLGDRLKVQVAAPPEAGKANALLCRLLAELLGLPARQVQVTAGHTQPRKTVLIQGLPLPQVHKLLLENQRV